jgi:hypothetical protein
LAEASFVSPFMSIYEEKISLERKKISFFQSKIEQCNKRIASLEFLQNSIDDAWDTLASGIVETLPKQKVTTETEDEIDKIDAQSSNLGKDLLSNFESMQPAFTHPRLGIRDRSRVILDFIGRAGKSLQEIEAFAERSGFKMTNQGIRNFAMIQRKNFGYLESSKKGFYSLTDRGERAIREQIESQKHETPTALTAGVSYLATESALPVGSATQGDD